MNLNSGVRRNDAHHRAGLQCPAMKRLFLPALFILAATLVFSAQTKAPAKAAPPPFTIVEASISDMRAAMERA
jgi:hypothetical protein